MDHMDEGIKKIHLVYFSGTGGTRRVAGAFRNEILNRSLELTVNDLDRSYLTRDHCVDESTLPAPDLVVLVFCLHAFDAPEPVYHWINETPLDNTRIAVISVSGGGDAWPNTGCRERCCAALEEKGFSVVYDRMMCMPSNWVFPVSDHAAMWMIRAIPEKVNLILDDLLAGVARRSHQKMTAFRSWIGNLEKQNTAMFPQEITITSACTGCGLCARGCPVNNISMNGRHPIFGHDCIMCFRCIYGCPAHAMTTGNFMVLKNGFDLDALEKRMQDADLEPVEKCCPGLLFKGVRDYLLDPDY